MSTTKIDRDKVIMPEITFTSNALDQLSLILENDFTLAGKFIRILISGKGCDGFTYSIGFTDTNDDDFFVTINDNLEVVIDPFTAFYLGKTKVDYKLDIMTQEEGFIIKNLDQEKYHGKFWREDKTLVPPQLQGTHGL
jgi:iron-sulfur cluster insertion protein